MANSKTRDRKITQGWLDALRKRAEFCRIPDRAQRELAHLIWVDSMRVREHFSVQDATSYPYQELDKRFGRSPTSGFKAINAATNAFFIGPWSHENRTTKSYQLAPIYKEAKRNYLKRERWKVSSQSGLSSGDVIDMGGNKISSLPNAIASKREDGSPARLWRGVKLTPAVPVDLEKLERLYKKTWEEIKRAQKKN